MKIEHESDGKRWLHKCYERYDYNTQVVDVETGSTALGVPDIFFAGMHGQGWVETKYVEVDDIWRKPIEIPWRPRQRGWLTDYAQLGYNANLLLFLRHKDKVSAHLFKGFMPLSVDELALMASLVETDVENSFSYELIRKLGAQE
jgi:hypothetical protein